MARGELRRRLRRRLSFFGLKWPEMTSLEAVTERGHLSRHPSTRSARWVNGLRKGVLGRGTSVRKGAGQRPVRPEGRRPEGMRDEVSGATSAGPGMLFWEQRESPEACRGCMV